MNIVIPMAGLGSRFSKAGYEKPKPFIDVMGAPMIERVLDNLYYPNAQYILIARKEHLDTYNAYFKSIEKKYNAKFVIIDKLTQGAACTVLSTHKLINNDTPLLIANSDQIVDINTKDFIEDCANKNHDGSILVFNDNDPKWSYAKVDDNGLVIEVKEKKPISDLATVGWYIFSKGKDFIDGTLDMISNSDTVNGEYYVCPVYNYLVKNKKIGVYKINKDDMHGLGTPEDLKIYLEKKKND